MVYWFIMNESSKMFITFLLLLICVNIAKVTNSLANNSENSCRNRNFNNREGICMSIYQCSPLFKLLENRPVSRKSIEILNKSQCGFSGLTPKVCCFSNEDDNNNITVLSTSDATLRSNQIKCGQYAEDRIFNGNTAALDQYPWDALLVYKTKNGTKFRCAGVLIGEKYVLTAAHCLSDELVSVRLGEHNIQTNPDCESWSSDKFCLPPFLEVPIQEKIPHESYEPENHHENDIALLKLRSKVPFSDFVAPVCLPSGDARRDFRNGRLVMTAWGIHSDQVKYMEKKTMTASVQSSGLCDFGNFSLNLTLKQVCVKSAQRFCVDDSGGAALDISTRTYDFYYYVAGILSFGSCNVRDQGRVYTRVDQYRQWISNKLKL